MPFTPSHAVVALVFRSPVVPAGAVAIGAMTPDLPLFVTRVPGLPSYGMTHDPRWLPLTVLLAAALWFLWRVALAPAVPDLAPGSLAARAPVPTPFPRTGPRIVGVVAALVIGIASHLVWDAFTHLDGWGTAHVPLLRDRIAGHPVYSVLQELSSVLGLAGLVGWLCTRTRHPLDERRRQRFRGLRGIVIGAVVAAAVVAVTIGLTMTGPLWLRLMTVATTGGVLVGAAICLGVGGWWFTTRGSVTADRR